MLPGRYSCPGTDWTLEYYGYLMTTSSTHESQTEYLCVDKNAQPLYRAYQHSSEVGGHIGHVKTNCVGGTGEIHNCSPGDTNRELACVVCTIE